MGEVFEVRDPTFDRPLAAKRAVGDDELLRERFLREARIVARLEHPGIVPVHDLAHDDAGRPFFTMKCIGGRTLHAMQAEGAPLLQLLRAFLAVCDTVAYAHSQGVLHRDLKPANVMVGEWGETYVLDWGLAREVARPDLVARDGPPPSPVPGVTLAGELVGTPGFVAPEAILGAGDRLDERADVYALGAILFALATGEPAFAGPSTEVLAQQLTGLDDARRASLRAVPFALAAIVAKALATSRRDRYPSAAALRDDVRRYLDDRPVDAARYGPLRWVSRWMRRHRGRLALVAAVTTSIGLAVAQRWRFVQRDRERTRARAAAIAADHAGAWADALREAERARASGDAADDLEVLQARAHERLRHEADAARLRTALEPIRRTIERVQLLRYIHELDLRPALGELAAQLATLEPLCAEPSLARFAELWATAGDASLLLADHARATTALRRARELDPANVRIRASLARALSLFELEPRQLPAPVTDERRRELAALLPDTDQADGLLGEVLAVRRMIAAEHSTEARERADRAIAVHGGELGSEELYLLRALTRTDGSELDDFTRALARRPHYPEAYLLRAWRAGFRGDWAAALADHERALALVPTLLDGRRGRARALIKLGRREEGMAELEHLHRDTGAPWDLSMLAGARIETGEFERGLAEIALAIRAEPDSLQHRLHHAQLLMAKGDPRAALAECDAAIALAAHRTESARALDFRARAWLQLGDAEAAERDLDQVLATVPHYFDGLRRRARLRFDRHADADAMTDLAAIPEADRQWQDWLGVGIGLNNSGRRAEALAPLRKAYELAPASEQAKIRSVIEHVERFAGGR